MIMVVLIAVGILLSVAALYIVWVAAARNGQLAEPERSCWGEEDGEGE